MLLPLYFPRSVHEAEFSRFQLPYEIGDPLNGEPVINDRRIRIIDNPQHAFQGIKCLKQLCYVSSINVHVRFNPLFTWFTVYFEILIS